MQYIRTVARIGVQLQRWFRAERKFSVRADGRICSVVPSKSCTSRSFKLTVFSVAGLGFWKQKAQKTIKLPGVGLTPQPASVASVFLVRRVPVTIPFVLLLLPLTVLSIGRTREAGRIRTKGVVQ
jgi:hypothetical protein